MPSRSRSPLFSLVAAPVVPWLFGAEWSDAARLVTLLSPPMILAGVFGLHNLLLMTLSRPRGLILCQLVATALAWSAAALLIPRIGAHGYAYAEIAAAAAWLLPAILVDRRFGRVSYDPALLWAGAASLAALAPLAGWWLVLAVPALALHRQTRRQHRRHRRAGASEAAAAYLPAAAAVRTLAISRQGRPTAAAPRHAPLAAAA